MQLYHALTNTDAAPRAANDHNYRARTILCRLLLDKGDVPNTTVSQDDDLEATTSSM